MIGIPSPLKYFISSFLYNNLKDLLQLGGRGLLHLHANSLHKVLSSVYPEYEWISWKFHSEQKDNSPKQFVNMVAKELNIQDLNDWYKITKEDLLPFKRANSILRAHNFSLYKLLSSVYPEHIWLPWKFAKAYTWTDSKQWKSFVDSIAKELNIKEMKDWYNIKPEVKKHPFLNLYFQ